MPHVGENIVSVERGDGRGDRFLGAATKRHAPAGGPQGAVVSPVTNRADSNGVSVPFDSMDTDGLRRWQRGGRGGLRPARRAEERAAGQARQPAAIAAREVIVRDIFSAGNCGDASG